MNDLIVTYEDPESLIADPDNARTHDARNLDAIRRSVKRFGVRKPVVAHEKSRVVYAGNGFLRVAIDEKLEKIPVAWIPHHTPTEVARAYSIADNQSALLADWDLPQLDIALTEAEEFGIETLDLGFDVEALEQTLKRRPDVAEDDFDVEQELKREAVSQTGDMWALGEHRLLCGDCTDKDNVERLMDGQKVELLFTSPPYDQQRTFELGVQDFDPLMCGMSDNIPFHETTQCLVNLGIFYKDGEWVEYWRQWLEHMASLGWRRFGWYVWDKLNGLPADHHGRLAPSFDFIFHLNKSVRYPSKHVPKRPENIKFHTGSGGLRRPNGKILKRGTPEASLQTHKIPDATIRLAPERNAYLLPDDGHPASFPVRLPSEIIQTWTHKDEKVYEPFGGSGTALIACEQLSRKCYAMEIEPVYVDVAVKRYVEFVGSDDGVFCEREGAQIQYSQLFLKSDDSDL